LRLRPYPFVGPCTFSVSAIRHPRGSANTETFSHSTIA
jgi:hypothetical protein